MTVPALLVTNVTELGCEMAGASSRTNAALLTFFFQLDVTLADEYARCLCSSELTAGGTAFHLVVQQEFGVCIYVDGIGYRAPLDLSSIVEDVYWTDPHQVGFFFWVTGGVTYWQYIFDGQLMNITYYVGTVNSNVNSFFNSRLELFETPKGNLDEVLYWRYGNALTDEQVQAVYDSYFQTDIYPVGFGEEEDFGVIRLVLQIELEVNCHLYNSTIGQTDFEAIYPCSCFDSGIGCFEFESVGPSPIYSCIC